MIVPDLFFFGKGARGRARPRCGPVAYMGVGVARGKGVRRLAGAAMVALCLLAGAVRAPMAAAQEAGDAASGQRPYCPERPGLNTPPCTMAPGALSIEAGLADWTRESDAQSVTRTLTGGDMLIRYGIATHAEVQLGWTAFGQVRERDRASGAVDRQSGTGDVTLGVKRNLIDPDGEHASVAVAASFTLPTGGQAIGAGDWGAGVRVPVAIPLNDAVTLEATPEIDAAVDEDRHGRHAAYGLAAGIGWDVSDRLNLTFEGQAMADRDPAGHQTPLLAALSAALALGDNAQVDVGAVVGVNHDAPDVEGYVGVSRRF